MALAAFRCLGRSKYKDKEGVERTSVEVIANSLQFLGSGQGKRPGSGEGPPAGAAPDGGDAAPPASDGFVDDDLPF